MICTVCTYISSGMIADRSLLYTSLNIASLFGLSQDHGPYMGGVGGGGEGGADKYMYVKL